MYFPSRSGWDFVPAPDQPFASGTVFQLGISGSDRLLHLDGTPAETFDDLVQANGAPGRQIGVFECMADLSSGRLVKALDGRQIAIVAIKWTEELHCTTQVTRIESEGEPCLVMQQLDQDGDPLSGRVFVDRDLHAWTIEENGSVGQRPLGLPASEATLEVARKNGAPSGG